MRKVSKPLNGVIFSLLTIFGIIALQLEFQWFQVYFKPDAMGNVEIHSSFLRTPPPQPQKNQHNSPFIPHTSIAIATKTCELS